MNWLISIFIFAIGFSCECARATCLSSMEHNRSTLIFQFVYGSEWLCEWVRLRVSRIRLKQHWLWVWHWSVFITRIPPSRILFPRRCFVYYVHESTFCWCKFPAAPKYLFIPHVMSSHQLGTIYILPSRSLVAPCPASAIYRKVTNFACSHQLVNHN